MKTINLCHSGIADTLKISKSSVENNFYHFGYVNHLDVWVSHKLDKIFLTISPKDSLLRCNKNVLILNKIVLDKEK